MSYIDSTYTSNDVYQVDVGYGEEAVYIDIDEPPLSTNQ